MQLSSFLLVAIFAVSIARCAPIPNATTFSDNAQQAQELNTKFRSLKITDQCQGNETACIGGDIMECVGGEFKLSEKCQDDRECFAIPNIQSPGLSLVCTTERNALGLIEAANVNGNVTSSGNNSTSSSSTSSGTSSTTTSLSTSSTGSPSIVEPPNRGDPGNNPAVVTVTVTEFADPRSTTSTATLSSSGTSSLPNNLIPGGLPSTTPSSSVPALTPAANPSSTPSSPSSPPVILLTAADGGATNPAPSPTPNSPSPIQLSAVAEEPTPAPSPSGPPNIPVGAGGGGGGYY